MAGYGYLSVCNHPGEYLLKIQKLCTVGRYLFCFLAMNIE